jgi:hypothetical protein
MLTFGGAVWNSSRTVVLAPIYINIYIYPQRGPRISDEDPKSED